eukprot:m.198386 g.198386  ORF g.198386 m.198386 type:complete len:2329 (-) comp17675_c0_seq5:272-7258(-)
MSYVAEDAMSYGLMPGSSSSAAAAAAPPSTAAATASGSAASLGGRSASVSLSASAAGARASGLAAAAALSGSDPNLYHHHQHHLDSQQQPHSHSHLQQGASASAASSGSASATTTATVTPRSSNTALLPPSSCATVEYGLSFELSNARGVSCGVDVMRIKSFTLAASVACICEPAKKIDLDVTVALRDALLRETLVVGKIMCISDWITQTVNQIQTLKAKFTKTRRSEQGSFSAKYRSHSVSGNPLRARGESSSNNSNAGYVRGGSSSSYHEGGGSNHNLLAPSGGSGSTTTMAGNNLIASLGSHGGSRENLHGSQENLFSRNNSIGGYPVSSHSENYGGHNNAAPNSSKPAVAISCSSTVDLVNIALCVVNSMPGAAHPDMIRCALPHLNVASVIQTESSRAEVDLQSFTVELPSQKTAAILLNVEHLHLYLDQARADNLITLETDLTLSKLEVSWPARLTAILVHVMESRVSSHHPSPTKPRKLSSASPHSTLHSILGALKMQVNVKSFCASLHHQQTNAICVLRFSGAFLKADKRSYADEIVFHVDTENMSLFVSDNLQQQQRQHRLFDTAMIDMPVLTGTTSLQEDGEARGLVIIPDLRIAWSLEKHLLCHGIAMSSLHPLLAVLPASSAPAHTSSSAPADEAARASSASAASAPKTPSWKLDFSSNCISIQATACSECILTLVMDNVAVMAEKDLPAATIEQVELSIQGQRLLTCTTFGVVAVDTLSTGLLQPFRDASRAAFAPFDEFNPITWIISSKKLDFLLANEFNLGDHIERIKSAIKVLKATHLAPDAALKEKALQASPVPVKLRPNFLFDVADAQFAFADDPFEVKLDINYELMRDEAVEQRHRSHLLMTRIQQRKETPGAGLTDDVVRHLFSALEEQNAAVYCQRAKQAHANAENVRPLMVIKAAKLKLSMLADRLLTGVDEALRFIHEVDGGSPVPPTGLQHSFLLGFKTNTSADLLGIYVRDYPKPLVEIRDMTIVGGLLLAEPTPLPTAMRTDYIRVGRGNPIMVKKGMTPIKVYQDLALECSSFFTSWGPALDFALSQFGLVTDLLSQDSVDPSPLLPWFDKARLLRHGPLTIKAKRFDMLLLLAEQPHNAAEGLLVSFTDFAAKNIPGVFFVEGDSEWSILTESKFNECPLFSMPGLHINVFVNFACLDSPHRHHFVQPTAPEFIPAGKLDNFDSFRGFRSLNVNYEVKVTTSAPTKAPAKPRAPAHAPHHHRSTESIPTTSTAPAAAGGGVASTHSATGGGLGGSGSGGGSAANINNAGGSAGNVNGAGGIPGAAVETAVYDDMPLCLLYSNTLRWLKRANQYMSQSNRPIRRGSHWAAVRGVPERPPKMSLGRHLLRLKLHALMENARLVFFNSYTRREGVHIAIESLDYQADFINKTLPKIDDKINRKEQKSFEVSEVNANFSGVQIMALQSVPQGDEGRGLKGDFLIKNVRVFVENLNSMRTIEQHFFLSSPCVQYVKPYTEDAVLAEYRSPQSATKKHKAPLPKNFFHEIQFEDLHFAWTPATREIVRSIMRTYKESRDLKFDLSPDAIRMDTGSNAANPSSQRETSSYDLLGADHTPARGSLLEQLLNVSFNKAHSPVPADTPAQTDPHWPVLDDDVIAYNILILFKRPQFGFVGPQSGKTITLTATQARLEERKHDLVRRQGRLDCKESWCSQLENVQFFAGTGDSQGIVWATASDMQGSEATSSSTLQRLVPACECRLAYVHYFHDKEQVRLRTQGRTMRRMGSRQEVIVGGEKLVDSVWLVFPNLHLHTNAAQWYALHDIADNLLLATDIVEQESNDRMETFKYRAQLNKQSEAERVGAVTRLQQTVRGLMNRSDELEKELMRLKTFHHQSNMDLAAHTPSEEEVHRLRLEEEWGKNKALLRTARRDLRISTQSLRESMIDSQSYMDISQDVERTSKTSVYIEDGIWKLLEDDMNNSIIDLSLHAMEFTKLSHTSGSGEIVFEMGGLYIKNQMNNEKFPEALSRFDIGKEFDRGVMLRVYSREGAPVGGIPVKEHFEINIVPIKFQISSRLVDVLKGFFFEDGPNSGEKKDKDVMMRKDTVVRRDTTRMSVNGMRRESISASSLNDSTESLVVDVKPAKPKSRVGEYVSLMKERAQTNITFVNVKIPSADVLVSYKGEISFSDVYLRLPLLEYQSRTCTWLDLLAQYQQDCWNIAVAEVVKHKVGLKTKTDMDAPGQADSEGRKLSFRAGRDKIAALFGKVRPRGESMSVKSSRHSSFRASGKTPRLRSASASTSSVYDGEDFDEQESYMHSTPSKASTDTSSASAAGASGGLPGTPSRDSDERLRSFSDRSHPQETSKRPS